MPVSQVVAAYLLGDYMHWRDEIFKWAAMPYPQAREGLQKTELEFKEWRGVQSHGMALASVLLPSVGRVCLMQAKLDRTRAALQTIEAIRSYAARHGAPPVTLAGLELPAPMDPVTGEPFKYETQGQSFTLTGLAPKGEKADQGGVRYEVAIKPAAATTNPAATSRLLPTTLPAGGAWKGIEPFIQDGTIALVHVDLSALTSDAAWRRISAVQEQSGLKGDAAVLLPTARDGTDACRGGCQRSLHCNQRHRLTRGADDRHPAGERCRCGQAFGEGVGA